MKAMPFPLDPLQMAIIVLFFSTACLYFISFLERRRIGDLGHAIMWAAVGYLLLAMVHLTYYA